MIRRFLKSLRPKTPRYLVVDGVSYDVNTVEGSRAYEKACDESYDIYKLTARIRNHVTDDGLSLTPSGIALCNTFAHFLKELHSFAEDIPGEMFRQQFKTILKKNEKLPGTFIKGQSPRKGSK